MTTTSEPSVDILKILIQEDRSAFDLLARSAPENESTVFDDVRRGMACGEPSATRSHVSDATAARSAIVTLKRMRPRLRRQLQGLQRRRNSVAWAERTAEISQVLFNLVAGGGTAVLVARPDLSQRLQDHRWLGAVVFVFLLANAAGRWFRKTASGGEVQVRLAAGIECLVLAEDLIDRLTMHVDQGVECEDFQNRLGEALSLITRIRSFNWE